MIIPREFFPNMPDEVFEMWLEPIAEDYGWPFQSPTDDAKETNWSKIFTEHPLSFWVNCKWSRIELDLATTPFRQITRFRVTSIIDGCVHGYKTLFTNMFNTQERFKACADFIRANNHIPSPVIVLSNNGVVEIIDGNHRIAALLHIGILHGYKIPAWITEINTNGQ